MFLCNRRQAPCHVEPLVVGLTEVANQKRSVATGERDNKDSDGGENHTPFLCSRDVILGAKHASQAFVCPGAASSFMFGTAEAPWKPDLTLEELVQVCGNAFLSALERDCLSGCGAILCLITQDGITEHDLASRNG
jgi:20S proteasome subunit beta 3